MAETIAISAAIRIRASRERVRAQYRDIDHHIRNNVHPSTHYEWQAGEPGERRIKTTFRVLGLPQYDVALLEDTPDGSFVIRYLEGTNAGTVLVHRFVELEPDVTEVQLSADAPCTLGRKILGPLFVVGARQVMKKALAEDKRDIEQGAYRSGAAAGRVEDALASLAAQKRAPASVKHAILEAACLICACDGSVDEPERDVILRAAVLLGAEAAEADASNLIERSLALASTPLLAAELARVGSDLAAFSAGREGVLAAAVAALVSQGLSVGECEALRVLAAAAALEETSLGALIEVADATLSAP